MIIDKLGPMDIHELPNAQTGESTFFQAHVKIYYLLDHTVSSERGDVTQLI